MPKILHIEDDAANRLLVRKLLAAAGMEVVDAVDGLEGIRRARELLPDLILVDISIPGLDGYEVTLRLRAEPALARVPIIAITAEGSRDASLAVGCDGFLQKPIAARTFAETILGFLGGGRDEAPASRAEPHLRAQSQRIVAHLEGKLEELSTANARLLELDQARREFYRNLSHELSTPMTPIVGYVRLLADEELGPLTQAQQKAVRALADCAERLRGLIDNLLDVTAIETGRMRMATREFDLAEVVRKELRRAGPHFLDRGLRVALDVPANLPALGDPQRVARAVGELLDNAAKFTNEGGAVGVRARVGAGGMAVVTVSDSGPGVAPDQADRIFAPFVQGDGSVTRAHGGAGVGLAVARGVARGHGGDVVVRSPAGDTIDGLTFGGAGFDLTLGPRGPAAVP